MGAGSSAHLGLCPHLCLALSPWLVLWMTLDLKITWMVWLRSFVHPDVLALSSISLFLLVVLYRLVFADLVVKSHLDLLLLHRSLFASKSVQEIHFGSSPREQMQKFHLYAVGSMLVLHSSSRKWTCRHIPVLCKNVMLIWGVRCFLVFLLLFSILKFAVM